MTWFTPYDTRPALIALFVLVAVWYGCGLACRNTRADIASAVLFYVGLIGLYLVVQTRFDYFSRHVFFIHRIQHLELHHVGPFLIALSAPRSVLAAAIPARWRILLRRITRHPVPVFGYRILQQPAIAGVLFVGLIAYWLWPSVHFHTMLSKRAYWTMNLSMIVDGLLFWWLILDPRPPGKTPTTHSIATRIVLLWAVMIGQILIAAPIALADHDIYTSYASRGGALFIDPLTDQQLGGLITWIPAAMMSVVGTLVLLNFSFRHSRDASVSDALSRRDS